ncbi:MAG: hypothetical protein EZS28_015685 [Streblomastix strix]|uniref:Uncharacterized protein n=1 Tax=Streblomastix strix TaxID=222440 RepID=A0A5J4W265_9EUKA|nr:MAG: hypothetical protein EZS28_015685 [Streblomastix strix]
MQTKSESFSTGGSIENCLETMIKIVLELWNEQYVRKKILLAKLALFSKCRNLDPKSPKLMIKINGIKQGYKQPKQLFSLKITVFTNHGNNDPIILVHNSNTYK